MKTLIKLEIVCENCEVYTLKGEDVVTFWIEDVTEQLFCDIFKSSVFIKKAGKVFLRLKNGDYKSNWSKEFDRDNNRTPSFWQRMSSFRDITSVSLYFDDDPEKEYQYNVVYEDEGMELGSPNKFQNTEFDSENNEIIIEIWKDQ